MNKQAQMQPMNDTATETHYSCMEIAEMWGLSSKSVRNLFRDDPRVLKVAHTGRRRKRDYVTLRIPESVVKQKHKELCR